MIPVAGGILIALVVLAMFNRLPQILLVLLVLYLLGRFVAV